MTKQTRRRFSPEYTERSVARLSEPGGDAGAEDNPVPLGPHPLGDAQGHDLAGLLAPALLRLPVVAAGADVAGCERLGPLYEIALIVEAVAEYVGPVHFVLVPDWYIVPPLTQRTRWD